MQIRNLLIISLLIALIAPVFASAQGISRAGTNDYLKNVLKYSNEQLTTRLNPEEREGFETAVGETVIEDPLGDVLNRVGTTSNLQVPWADIELVEVSKNKENASWDFSVLLGGTVPKNPHVKPQLFIFMDTTGHDENDEVSGIATGLDAEFSIQHNDEFGYYTDFRWYNTPEDFWGRDIETNMTFDIDGDTIHAQIPYVEMPENLKGEWRVVMAVKGGGDNQIDIVPGIGFPPPIGGEYPTVPFYEKLLNALDDLPRGLYILFIAVIGVILYLLFAFDVIRLPKRRVE